MRRVLLVLLAGFSLCAGAEQGSLTTGAGCIPAWLVAGPFANGSDVGSVHNERCIGYFQDHLAAAGGEAAANPVEGDLVRLAGQGEVDWQIVRSDGDGVVDFIQALQVSTTQPYVAYAFCEILAEKSRRVWLKVNSDDGVRLWLNGALIHDHHIGRGIEEPGDWVEVELLKGSNRLLAKVDQGNGGWALSAALLDLEKRPLRIPTRVHANPALAGKIRSLRFELFPFVLKSIDGGEQLLNGIITSGGLKNAICQVAGAKGTKPRRFKLGDIPPGQHRFEVRLPAIRTADTLQISLESATDHRPPALLAVSPPRLRQIYLVQHTHTDIGYTKQQHEMLAEYFRYIDLALDLCDRSDNYPDDARFRWTLETSWAAREYLRHRPAEQTARLKQRIAEGRIEVTGMLLNMSEIADENVLAASLQPIAEFRGHGIPVLTAMQNDVNGAAWSLIDYYTPIGVRYFTMGINPDRSILPFKIPTPFWWESPSGQRLLAFRADHYMTGNAFIPVPPDPEKSKRALHAYLVSLESRGYPYDRIAVQFNGYQTDNAPPSMVSSEVVKAWNETYLWPTLRLATVHEFPAWLEQQHAAELPVFRVAWPDWWTDGVGSAAREGGIVRSIHAELLACQGLLSQARLLGAAVPAAMLAKADQVKEALLFYDEHTYGAAQSISDPEGSQTHEQWGQKAAYAWEALRGTSQLREYAQGLLAPFMPKAKSDAIAVFNTLNWERSGLVSLFVDHEIIPATDDAWKFVDESGSAAAAVRLDSRAEGSRWLLWADKVPANGYKCYRIEPVARGQAAAKPALKATAEKGAAVAGTAVKETRATGQAGQLLAAKTPASSHAAAPRGQTEGDQPEVLVLENDYYRILLDSAAAAVTGILDKESGRELVDGQAAWRFGQLIYETLPQRGTVDRALFVRHTVERVRVERSDSNPLWQSVTFSAGLAGMLALEAGGQNPQVIAEIRLYRACKKIEFHYTVRKAAVTTPEALYVAFPWQLADGRIYYEAQGGVVEAGVNTLPGSASDWQTCQNFVALRSNAGQILMGSDRAPLTMFGDLNLGKWQYRQQIDHPHLYSYVMNNHWHTNFLASQQGEIRWSYYLTSTGERSLAAAHRFGWSERVPLQGRVLPAGKEHQAPASLSMLEILPANVLVVAMQPALDGSGVILHLRETAGEAAVFSPVFPAAGRKISAMQEVDVLQAPLGGPLSEVRLKPFASKFIKLSVN